MTLQLAGRNYKIDHGTSLIIYPLSDSVPLILISIVITHNFNFQFFLAVIALFVTAWTSDEKYFSKCYNSLIKNSLSSLNKN